MLKRSPGRADEMTGMGWVRSGILVAVTAALVMLFAVSSASAKRVHVHVNVKDQNGYRMSIEASRSARDVLGIAAGKIQGANVSAPVRAFSRRHAARVTRRTKASDSTARASSGFISVQVQNHHAISTYNVEGTVTHKRLFADLGDFGRISLHFHLRHNRNTHHGCISQHERFGVFRGDVRFRGEDDYVNVDAHALHGKVEMGRPSFGGCRVITLPPAGRHHKLRPKAKPGSRERHADRYTVLYAQRDSRSASKFFLAIKGAREYTGFLTDSFELQGPVFIDREEYGVGKAGDFRVAKSMNAAHVEPSPRAFRGSGQFRARHEQSHWKGSLATSFPGASHVRLAGRNFDAKLRRLGSRG